MGSPWMLVYHCGLHIQRVQATLGNYAAQLSMFARLRSLWTPPTFAESAASDQARLTFLLARLLLVASLAVSPLLLVIDFSRSLWLVATSLVWSLCFLIIMELVRRDRWLVATWAIPSFVLLGVTLLMPMRNVTFDIVVCGVLLTAVIAALLIGRAGALVFGALGIAYTSALLLLGKGRPAIAPPHLFPLPVHIVLLVGFLLTGVTMISVITAHLEEISHRDRALAAQLAASHCELDAALATQQSQAKIIQEERSQLAEHVAARTAELVDANRELNRALQGRNEFLTSVSHELRTPLNAIIGLTDALSEGVYGVLSDRQERSLRTVNQSGRQLLGIINDMLDVAKLEAGKVLLLPVSVPLEELSQSSLDTIRAEASLKGIRVRYRRDPRLTTLWGDSLRLKQILVNLLSNAVKFTNPNGEIGLEIDLNATAEMITFSVWDTGIGIAADDLPRLFQPFVQLDGRLNRQYGGTGLGLVIAKRLTELHHGSILVHSIVGQGSRFVVSFPSVAAALPETVLVMGQAQNNLQPQLVHNNSNSGGGR
jgi:signal transduction histidine kinase